MSRDSSTPPRDGYAALLACYRSDQMTERQWQEHLTADPEFRAWIEALDQNSNDNAGARNEQR